MKTAFELAALLLVLFVGISLLLYFFQERMIFFPQPTSPAARERYAPHSVTIRRGDVTLSGWFFKDRPGPDHPLIVYYGGNAEDISMNLADMGRFHTRSFLFMNYRGYGQSGGSPSETALCADALFVLDEMIEKEGVDPKHVVLMGRSLGSGVAVYVAARRQVGGVILVTPFDSLVNVARAHYPIFPVGMLLKHRFDSASLAGGISAPALFLTADADQVVPVRFTRNLERLWRGPVTSVTVAGTDHNSIETSPVYWDAINAFLRSVDRR